jgi:hypothetical protein
MLCPKIFPQMVTLDGLFRHVMGNNGPHVTNKHHKLIKVRVEVPQLKTIRIPNGPVLHDSETTVGTLDTGFTGEIHVLIRDVIVDKTLKESTQDCVFHSKTLRYPTGQMTRGRIDSRETAPYKEKLGIVTLHIRHIILGTARFGLKTARQTVRRSCQTLTAAKSLSNRLLATFAANGHAKSATIKRYSSVDSLRTD